MLKQIAQAYGWLLLALVVYGTLFCLGSNLLSFI